MMFRMFAVVNDSVPPLAPTEITIAGGMKEPALPATTFFIVEPFKLRVAPADAVKRPELSMLNVAPGLTVRLPVPRATAPEVSRFTVPSSTVKEAAVWVPESVTLKELTASLPAEKTASEPETQAAGVAVPAEDVLQNALVPHVPVGVAPAPAVVPFESQ